MKKMKPFKEKPGLKRFEINIYWGNNREASRLLVAPGYDAAEKNVMRSLNLQFKRDRVIVIGAHQRGRAHA